MILRTRRYTHDISGKDQPDIRILYTGLVGRYNSSDLREKPRTREKTLRRVKKFGKSRIPKSEFFMNKTLGHEIDENRKKPNKENVEAIVN